MAGKPRPQHRTRSGTATRDGRQTRPPSNRGGGKSREGEARRGRERERLQRKNGEGGVGSRAKASALRERRELPVWKVTKVAQLLRGRLYVTRRTPPPAPATCVAQRRPTPSLAGPRLPRPRLHIPRPSIMRGALSALSRPTLFLFLLFPLLSRARRARRRALPHPALPMAPSRAYSRSSLLSFLQEHGVDSETHDHAVVLTVEEQAKHVGHLDGSLSKNLFLKDKKNRLYVVSTLATTQVDLKALSARLGLGKGGVRMAPEESLHAVLQVPLGSVTPFALINESARSVALLLDVGFQKQSRVFFHPLSNDASTAVTPENLDKFLKAIGREPCYVDFEAAVVVGKDQPPDLAYIVPKDVPIEIESQPGTTGPKEPAVTPVAKPIPSLSTKKPKAAVSKAKDVARVDIATVLTSILHDAVAAAIAGVDSVTLDEEKKQAVTDSIDSAIRLRLAPDLESILMMFKNTMYAEGFKSAIESQRHSSTRH